MLQVRHDLQGARPPTVPAWRAEVPAHGGREPLPLRIADGQSGGEAPRLPFPAGHVAPSIGVPSMSIILSTVVGILVVLMIFLVLAVRIIKQYEQGVLFRLGRVLGLRAPGFRVIIPFVDVMHRVSMRIVTMPIQSKGSSPATT
jgi:hypothetical protein